MSSANTDMTTTTARAASSSTPAASSAAITINTSAQGFEVGGGGDSLDPRSSSPVGGGHHRAARTTCSKSGVEGSKSNGDGDGRCSTGCPGLMMVISPVQPHGRHQGVQPTTPRASPTMTLEVCALGPGGHQAGESSGNNTLRVGAKKVKSLSNAATSTDLSSSCSSSGGGGGGSKWVRTSTSTDCLVENAAAAKKGETALAASSRGGGPQGRARLSPGGACGDDLTWSYTQCNDENNMSGDLGLVPTSKALHINLEDNPNMVVYLKMERILKMMQEEDGSGVLIRDVKSFMNRIPSVFTGQDLVAWLQANLDFGDAAEALAFANRMAAFGYFFPIDDHVLAVKNDNTYYRFQTPYYWPSKNWAPENTDYAVYLCKRTMQNKARLELADYEAENLARLQKMFSRKWEYIFMQAESQSKVDKKREKHERKILDTQERAFWDVYRPPPGCVNTTELDIKKVCRRIQSSPPSMAHQHPDNLRAVALMKKRLRDEAANLRARIDKRTIKVSKCADTYVEFYQLHYEYDAFLVPAEPSNPWVSDSTDMWEIYEKCARDQVVERRVRRWAFGCWDLLKDPVGHDHFKAFLEKEYATENLLFVEAVWKMKKLPAKDVADECQRIWNGFLAHGADMLVNVDSTSHKTTEQNMEHPDRWTFDVAAAHLYYLMTSDSYSRYLRSSYYKDFLEGAKKNKTRTFALPKLSSAKINNIVP